MHRTIRLATYDDLPAIMPVIDAARAETPLFHKKKPHYGTSLGGMWGSNPRTKKSPKPNYNCLCYSMLILVAIQVFMPILPDAYPKFHS
jgi:hypothetical protein